jgi:hypothetical protein
MFCSCGPNANQMSRRGRLDHVFLKKTVSAESDLLSPKKSDSGFVIHRCSVSRFYIPIFSRLCVLAKIKAESLYFYQAAGPCSGPRARRAQRRECTEWSDVPLELMLEMLIPHTRLAMVGKFMECQILNHRPIFKIESIYS